MKEVPEFWYCLVTEENFDVLDSWRKNQPDFGYFLNMSVNNVLLSKHLKDNSYFYGNTLSAFKNNNEYKDYKEISYEQFCKYILKQTEMKTKTLTRNQLLSLRNEFTCLDWRNEIDNILTANILTVTEDYIIPDKSITYLKESGLQAQINAVKALGFNLLEPIDYNKLKCGSVVKIKTTSKHINGAFSFDLSKPVEIVLYKSPFILRNDYGFSTGGYSSQISFHQDNKYCCFSSHDEIDYITEVISY